MAAALAREKTAARRRGQGMRTQKGQRRKYSTGHKLLKAASPPSPGPGARGQGQGSGAWARGPGPAAQAEAQGPGDPGDRVRDTARVPRMLAKSRD